MFPPKYDHGKGDLMVLSKFGTIRIMTILHHQYNFNSYETYGWMHPWGRFTEDTSMVNIEQDGEIWDENNQE
jgi:hypothetical protein